MMSLHVFREQTHLVLVCSNQFYVQAMASLASSNFRSYPLIFAMKVLSHEHKRVPRGLVALKVLSHDECVSHHLKHISQTYEEKVIR